MRREVVVSCTTRTVHYSDCLWATWIRHGLCVSLRTVPVSQRRYLHSCGHCNALRPVPLV